MKKINFLFIPFYCFFLINNNSFEQPIQKGEIFITNGTLKIDNYLFNWPWTVKEFANSFGEVERITLKAHSIYIYDTRGIILYTTDDTVSDFNVYFGKDPKEQFVWVPRKLCKQSVIVETYSITPKTTLAKLQAALPQYHFEKSSIGAYRGEYNNLYVFVQFDKKNKKVYWISVGKKN